MKIFFSGIGYGVAQRLLDHSAKNSNEQFKIVLACRNETRATDAQNALLKEFPGGLVEIVLVDLSSVKSVFECCKIVKKRYLIFLIYYYTEMLKIRDFV